jgi:DNA repair protein RadC
MQVQEPNTAEKHRAIKEWAKSDRPREKLIIKGPEALTDTELLGVLIGKGTSRHNAIEIARHLLDKNKDDLHTVARRSVRDLLDQKVKGFGEAKAATLVAAFEIGRRRHAAPLIENPIFKDGSAAAQYVQPLLADHPHEVFAVLFLDQSNTLLHYEAFSRGGITATYVDPRLIFKRALQEEAVGIIVCHNHPSGNLNPSRADQILTDRLKEGAKYLDIKLLDHIIVSRKGYFSFAAEGLLS